MYDSNIEYIPVVMYNENPQWKDIVVPKGFRLETWVDGKKKDWLDILDTVNWILTRQDLEQVFDETFKDKELLKRRMFLLYTDEGKPVSTVTLWNGEFNSKKMSRLHWITTIPEYENQGLAKFMIQSLLNTYIQEKCENGIYLTTQTNSYAAINLYQRFGFKPIKTVKTQKAWGIIEEKISEYQM